MRHDHAQNLIRRLNIKSPVIFQDIDGPGTLNMGIAEREERPEKGIFVRLIGYKYPYEGLPDKEAVYNLAIIKKNIWYATDMLRSKAIILLAGLLMIMPFRDKIFVPIADYYKRLVDNYLHKQLLKPHRYSRCVRELYRTFEVIIGQEKSRLAKMIWEAVRDLSCMTVENDSAYKFRFQDILPNVKIKEILGGRKRMLAEIERLSNLMIKREISNEMKLKWKNLEKIIIKIAKWSPQFRGALAKFFKELDLKEIKMDNGVWYFCTMRMDYEFGGKPLKERLKEREQIEGDNWINFKDLASDFTKIYEDSIELEKRRRSENPIYRGLK